MKTADEVYFDLFRKSKEEWMSLFRDNADSIETSVSVYLLLKKMMTADADDRTLFKWIFLQYYGVRQHNSKDKEEKLFSLLDRDIKQDFGLARSFVNYINDDESSSSYFSYVTKILNMRNDDYFPIFDSRIARNVFGCDNIKTLDDKEKCYRRIKDLYDRIPSEDVSIVAFKEMFPQSAQLGKMRILDLMLYNTVKKK